MKKAIVIVATALVALGATAQTEQMTREELQRSFRQTVQKRDISQRHTTSGIALAPEVKGATKGTKGMPNDRFWFPGEWEELQAVVVTPYYTYEPATSQGSGYWMADPLVEGYAQYYKYTSGSWLEQGVGPYRAEMDTSSSFSRVSFYLMDAIQLGGAEAWVRVENADDTAAVLTRLQSLHLRHDNVRFLVAPGNSFWYRDCGPICFYYGEGDTVGMLDFEYYPGRALDDSLPVYIERQFGLPNYTTMIEWEGGNCLVDGAGMVFSSDAIYNNNNDEYGQLTWDGSDPSTINYSTKPRLNSAQVKDSLATLIGTRATYVLPSFHYDGGTGHVDLYADMLDENLFVFSIMPDDYANWYDYRIGRANMDSLCSFESYFGERYRCKDIPFPSRNDGSNFTSQMQYHSTYTRTYSNHTFVNNVIIQPCFSAVGSDGMPTAAWDRANIEQLKKIYAGYTLYCVDVREFDGSGGAIHCITKQIPADNPVRILHPSITGNTDDAYRSANAPITATITNRSGIESAKVVYRANGGQWNEAALTAGSDNTFSGEIPTSTLTSNNEDFTTVEYYISATSNNGKTITKPMPALQGGYYTFYLGHNPAVGIDAAEDEAFGQFYPNPAAGHSSIEISLKGNGQYEVLIVDLTGRIAHRSTLDAQGDIVYTVNTGKLGSGIYNVVFQNKNERVIRRLVVK